MKCAGIIRADPIPASVIPAKAGICFYSPRRTIFEDRPVGKKRFATISSVSVLRI